MRHNVTMIVLVTGLVGCTAAVPAGGELGYEETCKATVATLYAGETIDVGRTSITNTDTELVVRVETTGDWRIATVHLYAGIDAVPRNGGGNVTPGRFPYRAGLDPADAVAEIRIPLEDLAAECDTTLAIAVHADVVRVVGGRVVQREGAWAYGSPFGGAQWGWESNATICCEPEVVGCTLTQGYWKNHDDAWPVAGLSLGGEYYTRAQLLTILRTPVEGDASLILAHQLIAAELNAVTASVPGDVGAARGAADGWLASEADGDGRLPFGTHPSSAAGAQAVALAGVLGSYNEGDLGVPHCE